MSTVIYPSPIFGPIHSRRLGVSLGINLLPQDGKVCTFDCLYCECGLNSQRRPTKSMPRREEVRTALEAQLRKMTAEGPTPDVLTFAGNGEPTANPEFPLIIDDVIELRNRYFPNAKVSVLTNSTQILRDDVFEALKKVDNNILKLDTVDAAYIALVDRPRNPAYDVEKLIERMAQFNGHAIIQTMFMRGEYEGKSVDNVSDAFVNPWMEALRRIKPSKVMIYTIDRETPVSGLQKASHADLDAILDRLKREGFDASASY
ncbi:MAG: radical SAM protein [Bacteroidaceae bacterium]|nr:radical SAM protein [Bacteroidaceae bacterium]